MPANRGRSAASARRILGALVAALLLFGVIPAGADTKGELEAAKKRLAELEQQISAQQAHLADIQEQVAAQQDRLTVIKGELTDMAVQLDKAQNALDATRGQLVEVHQAWVTTKEKYEGLRDQLDERARVAYEIGPGSSLSLILGSTSVGELSDRLEFVDQLSALDSQLAAEVQNHANELAAQRRQLEEIKARQNDALADLSEQNDALNAKFAEAQGIYDDLAAKQADAEATAASLRANASEADSLVSKLEKQLKAEEIAAAKEAARKAREAARKAAEEERRREQQQQQPDPPADPPSDPGGGDGGGGGDTGGGDGGDGGGGDPGGGTVSGSPFSVCPVDEPKAYGDSFGAPRYAGGYHPHAGNDIMAPEGTPIRATFSGTAEAHPNGLGGNSVIVYGSEGWTYNAHLSSYGTLGSVSAGTIIGYVGNTGDAQGGPTHDHFEWHPNVIPSNPYVSVYGYSVIGDAIDPYPFLNMVC